MTRNTDPRRYSRVCRAVAALALLLGWIPCASAQTPHAELPPYGDLIYAEAAQLPGDSAGLCRLDLFLRIAHDYIVFHRNGDAPGDSSFTGGVELSIDVFDAQGQTVETANTRKVVRVPNYLATESRDAWLLQQHTFRLAPGRYRVSVLVDDGKSTRQRSIQLPVTLKSLTAGTLALGSVLPLEDSVARADHAYRVFAFGASVPYARPSLLAVSCSAGADAQWRYALTRNDPRARDDRSPRPPSRRSRCWTMSSRLLACATPPHSCWATDRPEADSRSSAFPSTRWRPACTASCFSRPRAPRPTAPWPNSASSGRTCRSRSVSPISPCRSCGTF
ncbi:MAG: hypothetical protein IPP94_10435 [Ignavibacteria bacterium]|nr:hypothetical protein [Ignavibacteria bacterium]